MIKNTTIQLTEIRKGDDDWVESPCLINIEAITVVQSQKKFQRANVALLGEGGNSGNILSEACEIGLVNGVRIAVKETLEEIAVKIRAVLLAPPSV